MTLVLLLVLGLLFIGEGAAVVFYSTDRTPWWVHGIAVCSIVIGVALIAWSLVIVALLALLT